MFKVRAFNRLDCGGTLNFIVFCALEPFELLELSSPLNASCPLPNAAARVAGEVTL